MLTEAVLWRILSLKARPFLLSGGIMNTKQCEIGARVWFKHKSTYGAMQIKRLVPKQESGTTFWVVEVLHSSNDNFDFAFVKQFPMSILTVKQSSVFKG
jgi:hypothetical protein